MARVLHLYVRMCVHITQHDCDYTQCSTHTHIRTTWPKRKTFFAHLRASFDIVLTSVLFSLNYINFSMHTHTHTPLNFAIKYHLSTFLHQPKYLVLSSSDDDDVDQAVIQDAQGECVDIVKVGDVVMIMPDDDD